jgi:lipopolysaccharide-induced tumor necrosis factor-alpha factor
MNTYPQPLDNSSQQQPPVYPSEQVGNSQLPYPQQSQGSDAPGKEFSEPQPEHHGAAPHQQSDQVYLVATPIALLNRGPAPVDCPACGRRALTTIEYESGMTTQYAYS